MKILNFTKLCALSLTASFVISAGFSANAFAKGELVSTYEISSGGGEMTTSALTADAIKILSVDTTIKNQSSFYGTPIPYAFVKISTMRMSDQERPYEDLIAIPTEMVQTFQVLAQGHAQIVSIKETHSGASAIQYKDERGLTIEADRMLSIQYIAGDGRAAELDLHENASVPHMVNNECNASCVLSTLGH